MTRDEAISKIWDKLSKDEEGIKKFILKGFEGFEKLSNKQIERFLNIYALGLSIPDSVKVIDSKILTREQLEAVLINKFTSQLSNSSNAELQKLADQTLEGFVKLESVDDETFEEEIVPESSEPEEPPFEVEPGEGDLDSPENVESPDIEEETDEFDTDDVVWVEGEEEEEEEIEVDTYQGIDSLFENVNIHNNARAASLAKDYSENEVGGFQTVNLKNK